MTKREQRVINAFCNCVRNGEFSDYYAITLIEDQQRYGWMGDGAKETFYEFLASLDEERAAASITAPDQAEDEEQGSDPEENGETDFDPEPVTEEEQEDPGTGAEETE